MSASIAAEPLPSFAQAPSLGSNFEAEPRVLLAQFGDGYNQRAADGINNVLHKGNVTWENLTRDEAATLISFLRERAGWKPITWTMPGDNEARKWVATRWTRTYVDANLDTVAATFSEVVDL